MKDSQIKLPVERGRYRRSRDGRKNIYFHYFIFFRFIEFLLKIKILKKIDPTINDHQLWLAVTYSTLVDITSSNTIEIGEQYYEEKSYVSQLRWNITASFKTLFEKGPLDFEYKIEQFQEKKQPAIKKTQSPYAQFYKLNPEVTTNIFVIAKTLYAMGESDNGLSFKESEDNADKKKNNVPANTFTFALLDCVAQLNMEYASSKGMVKKAPFIPDDMLKKLFDLVDTQVGKLLPTYMRKIGININITTLKQLRTQAGNQAESSSSSASEANLPERNLGQKRLHSDLIVDHSNELVFNKENEPALKKIRLDEEQDTSAVATALLLFSEGKDGNNSNIPFPQNSSQSFAPSTMLPTDPRHQISIVNCLTQITFRPPFEEEDKPNLIEQHNILN